MPAEGNGLFHTFVFPLNNTQTRYLRAIDYAPSDPKLLHGALFTTDSTGSAEKYDAASSQPGYAAMGNHGLQLVGSHGSWVIGQQTHSLPSGYGWRVPPHSSFSIQTHFNPVGRSLPLTQELALYYCDSPRYIVTSIALGNLCIDIPPGSTQTLSFDYTLPVPVKLVGLFPQAHFVCSSLRIDLLDPLHDTRKSLLTISDWDPNWMQLYRCPEPLTLAAGTVIHAEYTFDNSTANLQNPHSPPRRILLGRMPDDELALLLIHVAPLQREHLEKLENSHEELFRRRQLDYQQWLRNR